MRILIDLQGVQTDSRRRGIGRYSLALAEAMLRDPRDHEFWILLNDGMGRDGLGSITELLPPQRILSFASVQPTHWRDPGNAWRRGASERIREAFLRDLQPDIVHVSSLVEGAQDAAVTSIGVRSERLPTAATLYDLIPLHDPTHLDADWVRSWYMSKMESLGRADVLLAISDYVRRDAIETLGCAPDRVVNISSAASGIFRPIEVTAALRAQLLVSFGIRGKYVMYSGAMDPRKNLERLLAAYARLPGHLLARHQLVVTGHLTDLEKARLVLVARRHGLPVEQVVITGYVTDAQLVQLYCAAEVFVFPSLQEGFGLPALEAMACGAPVIGSALSSLPEVIGRSDALFDPTSIDAIAVAILRCLENTAFSNELRQHGLRQASTFSWESSAARALDAFESVHRKHSRSPTWQATCVAVGANQAALVDELVEIVPSRDLVPVDELVQAAVAIAANQEVALDVWRESVSLSKPLAWRVEGPFDSSYSLALVNRELALALHQHGVQVALHSADGEGDVAPSHAFLSAHPQIAALNRNADKMTGLTATVTSRLMYPPRVADMASPFNLLHAYAWEESALPQGWVDEFNEFLQGVSALSTHVQKVLIDNGVGLPISVCGAGVDHWDRIGAADDFVLKARSFRFLHISSCMPRKGVDVLLKAYGDSYSDADDVSLVIKTFANPMNQLGRWLAEARAGRQDFPHVEIIEADLSEAQLKSLYEQCDVMVAPSRAEGFGLPMAEAMLSNLAVITTAWGGQCDFCTPESAWLIDYEFVQARTAFGLPQSIWAEPSRSQLAETLREVHRLSPEARIRRVRHGQALLRNGFQWSDVAKRLIGFSQAVASLPIRAVWPVTAWVGSYADDADVRTHQARALIQALPGEVHEFALSQVVLDSAGDVLRHSPSLREGSEQVSPSPLDAVDVTTVLMDLASPFWHAPQFLALVREQRRRARTVVVLLREMPDASNWGAALAEALNACDRVLVGSIADLNMLRRQGIVNNAALFSMGLQDEASTCRASVRLWNLVRALAWQKAARVEGLEPGFAQESALCR
ncbi:glycosyltransferase [Xanthomonas sp. CFBP 8700]|nr:glycosyltransferase [Xanthomonas bonasiae]